MTTTTEPAPAPAVPSNEDQLQLAVATFTAICTRSEAGHPIERSSDLIGELPEAFQHVDGLLTKLAVLVRALASGDLITDTMPAAPTAFGITVHAQGDAALQILAKDVIGWRSLVAAAQLALELSQLDNQKKDDELRAHKERVRLEKELAGEVTACEADVEAAKNDLSAAKEHLAAANKKLAAFVRCDVQTSMADGKQETISGDVTAYEQGFRTFDASKAEAINPYRDDPQKADWQRGYDWAKKQAEVKAGAPLFDGAEKAPIKSAKDLGKAELDLLGFALDDNEREELRRGTALNVAGCVLNLYERDYLVADAVGETHFLMLPLYSKDEWASIGHEAKYGRTVEGVDQTDEAKVQRQTGGEFCGRVVKLGKKKLIVGPKSDALIVWDDQLEQAPAEGEKDGGQDEGSDGA